MIETINIITMISSFIFATLALILSILSYRESKKNKDEVYGRSPTEGYLTHIINDETVKKHYDKEMMRDNYKRLYDSPFGKVLKAEREWRKEIKGAGFNEHGIDTSKYDVHESMKFDDNGDDIHKVVEAIKDGSIDSFDGIGKRPAPLPPSPDKISDKIDVNLTGEPVRVYFGEKEKDSDHSSACERCNIEFESICEHCSSKHRK